MKVRIAEARTRVQTLMILSFRPTECEKCHFEGKPRIFSFYVAENARSLTFARDDKWGASSVFTESIAGRNLVRSDFCKLRRALILRHAENFTASTLFSSIADP